MISFGGMSRPLLSAQADTGLMLLLNARQSFTVSVSSPADWTYFSGRVLTEPRKKRGQLAFSLL